MANIEVVGLESTGGSTGQLRSARPGTDTYKVTGSLDAIASNAAITLSPTGTGTVAISPAGTTTLGTTGQTTTLNGNVSATASGQTIQLSPTGTGGTVTIAPAGTGTAVSIAPSAGSVSIAPNTAGSITNMSIGSSNPSTGAFTTLSASSTVSGTGFSNYLASPPAIGGTAAAAGTFTQLTVNGSNLNTTISPTGTGTVAISPAGALTINPTAASTINNASIGATTASTGRFTSVETTTGTIGAGTTPVSGAWVKTAAGTTSTAPILLTSGTNLTTATAGSVEYDGKVGYFTPTAISSGTAARGLLPTFYAIVLPANGVTTTYTTPNAVNIFASTGVTGVITLPATATTTTYIFECLVALTGTSATAGTISFGLGGTATYTNVAWSAMGNKNANATSPFSATTNAQTVVSASNTGTNGFAMVKGIFTVGTAGGTVIPQISASQSTTNLTIYAGSYFNMVPVGSGNNYVGPWT